MPSRAVVVATGVTARVTVRCSASTSATAKTEPFLAFTAFPIAHWRKIRSTNPLERINGEIKRRTNVVGIFPQRRRDRPARHRGARRTHDEWAVSERSSLSEESMAKIGQPIVTVEEATLAITA
jgi:transposase-like protein